MAFTAGSGVFNLFTAGIIISASYRAGHALMAFRKDVKAGTAEAQKMTLALATARASLIKFGLGAVGIAIIGSQFKKVTEAAQDLEVTLNNIRVITGANTNEMDKFVGRLMEVNRRTRFDPTQIASLAEAFALQTPILAKHYGMRSIADLMQPVAEAATILEALPGKQFAPKKTVQALAQLVNQFVGIDELLGPTGLTKARQVINFAAKALIAGPYNDPVELPRALGFMRGVPLPVSMEDQFAMVASMRTLGLMPGRSAQMPGRAIQALLFTMFDKPEFRGKRMSGLFGEDDRKALGLTDLLYGQKQFGSLTGADPKSEYMRKALGLDKFREQLLEGATVNLTELFAAIRQKALSVTDREWGTTVQLFPQVAQRFIATFHDVNQNFVEMFSGMKRVAREMPELDTFINAGLAGSKIAHEAFKSNLTGLAAVIGLQITPSLARFYNQMSTAVMWMTAFTMAHPVAIKALLIFAGTLTSIAATRVGWGLGSILTGLIASGWFAKYMTKAVGATVLGALGISAPIIGALIGFALTLPLIIPLFQQLLTWVKGPSKEQKDLDAVAKSKDKETARFAEEIRKGNIGTKELFEWLNKQTTGEEDIDGLSRGIGGKKMFPGAGVGAGSGIDIANQLATSGVPLNQIMSWTRAGLIDVSSAFGLNIRDNLADTTKTASEVALENTKEQLALLEYMKQKFEEMKVLRLGVMPMSEKALEDAKIAHPPSKYAPTLEALRLASKAGKGVFSFLSSFGAELVDNFVTTMLGLPNKAAPTAGVPKTPTPTSTATFTPTSTRTRTPANTPTSTATFTPALRSIDSLGYALSPELAFLTSTATPSPTAILKKFSEYVPSSASASASTSIEPYASAIARNAYVMHETKADLRELVQNLQSHAGSESVTTRRRDSTDDAHSNLSRSSMTMQFGDAAKDKLGALTYGDYVYKARRRTSRLVTSKPSAINAPTVGGAVTGR